MRRTAKIFSMVCLLFFGCGSQDRSQEIGDLIAAGDIQAAKSVYRTWVDETQNPNIERDYLAFLFEHKQYLDFRNGARDYLGRFPQDTEIRDLQFEYYAKLARDAERTDNFEDALDYIVTYLLNPDFADYRKWESRQTTILRKWFQSAVDKNDYSEQKVVVSKMLQLGLDNLAESLAPEIYAEIAGAIESPKVDSETADPAAKQE